MTILNATNPWVSYWNLKTTSGSQIDETQSLGLERFWAELTPRVNNVESALELGPGDKPVIDKLSLPSLDQCFRVTTDISHTALTGCPKDTAPVCANGREPLPFKSASFDLIVSQFGAEYCGMSSVKRLTHYLRPGGTIALICHHRGSFIYKVYMNSKRALEQLEGLDLYECLRNVLSGYSSELDIKIKQLELILHAFGADVCGGFISLIREFAICIEKSEPGTSPPSAENIDEFEFATASYAQLVQSMLDAALSKSQLDDLITVWESQGFRTQIKQVRNNGLSIGTQITATHVG
jgi:hypothetical protein